MHPLRFALLELADPERVPSKLLGAAYLVLIGALERSLEARSSIEGAFESAIEGAFE